MTQLVQQLDKSTVAVHIVVMMLKNYHLNLSAEQKKEFANRINTSVDYVRIHLIPKGGEPDRTPPLFRLILIADATAGSVSLADVCDHFSKGVQA